MLYKSDEIVERINDYPLRTVTHFKYNSLILSLLQDEIPQMVFKVVLRTCGKRPSMVFFAQLRSEAQQ